MIRVMVVAEDPPLAKRVKGMVEKYGEGFEVTSIAANGHRALESMEKRPVDLVIAHFSMAGMGGLELARRLSWEGSGAVVALFGDRGEMARAQSAGAFWVEHELPLPASQEQIVEAMERVRAAVEKKRQEEARFLLEQGVGWKPKAHPSAPEREYGVMLLCGGACSLTPGEELPESRERWSAGEIEAHIRTRLEPGGHCVAVWGRSQRERAVAFTARDSEAVQRVAREFYSWIAGRGEITVTLAVWGKPVSLGEAEEVLAKLRGRIYKQTLLFRSQLLLDHNKAGAAFQATEQQAGLIHALRAKDLDQIRGATAGLVDLHVKYRAKQTELARCLKKAAQAAFQRELSGKGMEALRFEVCSAISCALRPSELSEELSRIYYSWAVGDNLPGPARRQELCEEMAAYLRIHCRENIREVELAQRFGLPAARLAQLFREQYHCSIPAYVHDCRVKKAQEILRRKRGIPVEEVAEMVGYNDVACFTKVFRKIAGVCPAEAAGRAEW